MTQKLVVEIERVCCARPEHQHRAWREMLSGTTLRERRRALAVLDERGAKDVVIRRTSGPVEEQRMSVRVERYSYGDWKSAEDAGQPDPCDGWEPGGTMGEVG